MQSNDKKKILLLASSLAHGGAEKAMANLSIMLSRIGYCVYIVVLSNHIDYDFAGTLVNLGKEKDRDNSMRGKIKRFSFLRTYIRSNNIEVIIDGHPRSGLLKPLFYRYFIFKNKPTIYMVHSSRMTTYFHRNRWLSKWFYAKSNMLVAVSNAIENQVRTQYGIKNVMTIHNGVDLEMNASLSDMETAVGLPSSFVLFFGRLNDDIKNISFLLRAYSTSDLPKNRISLVILGDGPDVEKLQILTKSLGLETHVDFIPYVKNPFPIIRKALCSVLTSRYEGFPMVLVESLSVGTPVVSVDCVSGPSEIIQSKINGLLVANHDEEELALALNQMALNHGFNNSCREQAKNSVERFTFHQISKKWEDLIKTL